MSLISIFGPKRKDFLSIGNDNRVNIWEVEEQKVMKKFIEKNHLSHKYTCFDWSHGRKNDLGILAVGCNTGAPCSSLQPGTSQHHGGPQNCCEMCDGTPACAPVVMMHLCGDDDNARNDGDDWNRKIY